MLGAGRNMEAHGGVAGHGCQGEMGGLRESRGMQTEVWVAVSPQGGS